LFPTTIASVGHGSNPLEAATVKQFLKQCH
jgi:hypothetical protein